MDDDTHASDNLLHDANLRETLGEPQLSGNSQRRAVDNYQFDQNNRDQLAYKVVQMANSNNNTQAGLNIINTSELQNFLAQQGAANNDSSQVAIVTTNSFTSANTLSDPQAVKAPSAYLSSTARSNSSLDQESSQSDQNSNPSHFYLLMSPQDVVTGQAKQQGGLRSFDIAKLDDGRTPTTRRVHHNEVERRRRDKINNWIMKLSDMVPSCSSDQTKQGQSKGGILAKTCDYIVDLQQSNQQFEDITKELERLQFELKVAKMQLKDQKQENEILHQTLRDHGLAVDITTVDGARNAT